MLLNKPIESHTKEELTIESSHPWMLEQATSLDDAGDMIDLIDDSEMTTSQQSDSLQNNTSKNELQFYTCLFINTAAEYMDDMQHDIAGFKLYKIKCSSKRRVQKSQDLRYFKMHTSRRKDLIGTRKVGRCMGNLYCAFDDCPFKFTTGGKQNTTNFQNVGGHKVCFSCGNVASRQWCGAHKMTEYCRESKHLTVYHIGAHKCPLKLDTMKYRKQVRDAVLRNSGLGA